MRERQTSRSRGFGFVFFASSQGLEAAVAALDGAELDGRRVSVTRAVPQEQTAPGTPASALGGGRKDKIAEEAAAVAKLAAAHAQGVGPIRSRAVHGGSGA